MKKKSVKNEKEIRMMKSSDELSKEESKNIKAIMNEKSGNVKSLKNIIFFNKYKMVDISAET